MSQSGGAILIAQRLGGGGIERNMEAVAMGLLARGRRIALASWQIEREIGGRPNPILARLTASGVPVARLPFHPPLSLPRLGWHLARFAQQWGAEALVGKDLAAALAAMFARTYSRGRLRVTAEFHNATDAFGHTGLSLAHRQLARWLLPRADQRIAVSAATRRDVAAFFSLQPESVAVIFNPLELPPEPGPAAPQDAGAPAEIVGCGRLAPMKGFDLLLLAFARVRSEQPARLTILGEGPQRESLRTLARNLGLETVCRFTGHVADPRPFFRRASVVVSASRFGESWGLALAEAMSVGAPVVATRLGGVEELLGSGRYGLLVPPGDSSALAAAIAAIFADPAAARRRAAAAQLWVQSFAAAGIVPQLEACYWRAPRAAAAAAG